MENCPNLILRVDDGEIGITSSVAQAMGYFKHRRHFGERSCQSQTVDLPGMRRREVKFVADYTDLLQRLGHGGWEDKFAELADNMASLAEFLVAADFLAADDAMLFLCGLLLARVLGKSVEVLHDEIAEVESPEMFLSVATERDCLGSIALAKLAYASGMFYDRVLSDPSVSLADLAEMGYVDILDEALRQGMIADAETVFSLLRAPPEVLEWLSDKGLVDLVLAHVETGEGFAELEELTAKAAQTGDVYFLDWVLGELSEALGGLLGEDFFRKIALSSGNSESIRWYVRAYSPSPDEILDDYWNFPSARRTLEKIPDVRALLDEEAQIERETSRQISEEEHENERERELEAQDIF